MKALLPAAFLAAVAALVRSADLAGVVPTVAARTIEGSLFLLFLVSLALVVPWEGGRAALPLACGLALVLAWLENVIVFAPVMTHVASAAIVGSYGPMTVWPGVALVIPSLNLHASLTVGRALLLGFSSLVLAMALRAGACRSLAAGGAGGLFVSACASCTAPAFAIAAVAGIPVSVPAATSLLATFIDLGVPLAAVIVLVAPTLRGRVALAALGAIPILAVGDLPSGSSDMADLIHRLYVVFNVVAVLVTGAFLALLITATIRGRGAAHARAMPPITTRRRVIWAFTLGLLGLFMGMMALSLHAQQVMESTPGPDAFHVKVAGIQWGWQVTYADNSSTLNELRVPVGKEVTLEVTSRDVAHGLFVPDLGIQVNAIPGRVNSGHFTVYRAGEWDGRCNEYCGIGHTDMNLRVVAS